MTKEKEVEEAIKNVKAAWNTDTYPAHVWARMATVLATALEAAQQPRATDGATGWACDCGFVSSVDYKNCRWCGKPRR